MFLGNLAHQLNGGTVRDFFHHAVPSPRLFGTKVRAGEDFLHAQDLRTFRSGLFDQLQMLFNRVAFDLFERFFSGRCASRLNEGTSDSTGHDVSFRSLFAVGGVGFSRRAPAEAGAYSRRLLRTERSQYRTNANPNVTNHRSEERREG